MCDYVVPFTGTRSTIGKVDVIEEYDSRQHKLVRFEVWCKNKPKEVNISILGREQ